MMREMRRQDRLLSREDALQVLNEAEYGVLSTVTPDGMPYGLPINYALDGDRLYMHCTPVGGQKLDNLAYCPNACMTAVTGVKLNSHELTTAFRSAMAFGTVAIVTDPSEKVQGLRALLRRLAPEYSQQDPACMGDLSKVMVLRMQIDSVSGKFHL